MRRSARPIRWWLATFGAAVALPFILLIAAMFILQIRSESVAARMTALRVARAAGDRLVGLRSDSLALLTNMASRPSIQRFETQPCDSMFGVVDFFPQYVNLFLFDRDGNLHCAVEPRDFRDRAISAYAERLVEKQLRQSQLELGKLTIQQSAGQWVSTLSIPSGGNGTLVLVALPEIVAKESLPAGAVVTITNKAGVILARSSDNARWVGRNARGRPVRIDPEGTAEAVGVDDVSRQYGYTFVPQLGWYISVGIPTSALMAPVRRLYLQGLIAGLLVIFVAVVVALIVSQRVARPINQLAAGAASVARGEYDKVEPPHRAPLEITTLADAFNGMVDSRAIAERLTEESEQRLKALSDRLLIILEEERTRIARAIHDDLGQSLTALKMDVLGLLEKNQIPSTPTTERIERTLDSTVSAVQQIAKELRPSMLDDLGLIPALEADVRLFEERTGIECDLSLPEASLDVDRDVSTVLYRIIQEALTNVMRHSDATRVEIRLRQRSGEVLLEVRDDGRGITADQVSSPTSLGLMGIRERAAIIGGRAGFEGLAGRGTVVSVCIPVGDRVRAAS